MNSGQSHLSELGRLWWDIYQIDTEPISPYDALGTATEKLSHDSNF